MTEEEFYNGMRMLGYFWDNKGDITRWSGWEEFKPELEKLRPDIAMVIENYLKAERVMRTTMKNL